MPCSGRSKVLYCYAPCCPKPHVLIHHGFDHLFGQNHDQNMVQSVGTSPHTLSGQKISTLPSDKQLKTATHKRQLSRLLVPTFYTLPDMSVHPRWWVRTGCHTTWWLMTWRELKQCWRGSPMPRPRPALRPCRCPRQTLLVALLDTSYLTVRPNKKCELLCRDWSNVTLWRNITQYHMLSRI